MEYFWLVAVVLFVAYVVRRLDRKWDGQSTRTCQAKRISFTLGLSSRPSEEGRPLWVEAGVGWAGVHQVFYVWLR
jgi:hypothetical protein